MGRLAFYTWVVKKEENCFGGDSQLPSQIARTRVRLLYHLRLVTNTIDTFANCICQAHPKSKYSLAELAIESDFTLTTTTTGEVNRQNITRRNCLKGFRP